MKINAYQAVLDRCGGRQDTLSERARWRAMQEWRNVYAAPLHAATGRWKKDGFEWHVFSLGYAEAISGLKAVAAYESEQANVMIVCPESTKLPAVRIDGGGLPNFQNEDVYAWPEDLGWTMAFTHEESIGLGPYFCRREWLANTPPREQWELARRKLRR
jgi:hypothetical protein